MKKRIIFCVLSCALAGTLTATAQVRVSKSAGDKTALDCTGLTTSGTAGILFRRTLEADLVASGWFQSAPGRGELRLTGEAVDTGKRLEVECRIFNVGTQAQLFGQRYKDESASAAALAHKVADEIVLKLTGHRGMASALLLLTGNLSGTKEVYLMNADGSGLRQLTRDGKVCIGPRWGPENRLFTYTGYLQGFPDVYQVELATGKRGVLSRESGLNTGAVISPDGRKVALILSRDGNPELYVKDMRSGQLTRLTRTDRAAEASPCWSPDGREIAYVSDSPGSPQIYIMSASGGRPRRLSSRGSENVAPDWGPNGLIASSSRIGGRYEICITHPETLQIRVLTGGDANYEDPSWAPDGRHLACTRTVAYRSAVFLLDTQGDAPRTLTPMQGDWYAPDWSN